MGADKDVFSIIPLSGTGVPAGTTDCGTGTARLQQDTTGQSNPPAGTSCGALVQFTPPDNGTRINYYADLRMPNSNGGTHAVRLVGCDARVAAAAGNESCFQGVGGEVSGGGGSSGDDEDQSDGDGGTAGGGSPYVDPSGTVLASDGTGPAVPFAGATVTLLQSVDGGTPGAVPNGSAVMSPANRTNPMASGPSGTFGWDVLAGLYQVEATTGGCYTARSPLLVVPPPRTGLVLTLACSASLPARPATSTTLAVGTVHPRVGRPEALTATVGGGVSPSGTVTFKDGNKSLGTSVLDAGTATLQVTFGSGTHHVTASYSGDAANKAATSAPRTVVVENVAIRTASLPVFGLKLESSATLAVRGATRPVSWSVAHGSLPSGLHLSAKGVLSGKGKARQSRRIVIRAKDKYGATALRVFRVVVAPIATLAGPVAAAHGKRITLHGRAVPGVKVTLSAGRPGDKLRAVKTTKAARSGAWSVALRLSGTRAFRAVADGAKSRLLIVGSNPTLTGPSRARTGHSIRLTGLARPGTTVTLDRAGSHGGFNATAHTVANRRTGRFAFDVVVRRGTSRYRAVANRLSSTTKSVAGR